MQARVLAAAAALAVAASAAPIFGGIAAEAATVMPTTVQATCLANCFDQTHTYKQTIAAGSFTGPVSIGGFTFDRSLLGADFQTNVFHVTFWTADGKEVGDFGHYMVGSLGGQILKLNGDSFTYDPTLGNLVMKIELDGFGPGGMGGFGGGGGFGGAPSVGGDAPGGLDRVISTLPPALADTTNITPLALPVPEPTGWALMLTGFLGAGAMLRRRARLA